MSDHDLTFEIAGVDVVVVGVSPRTNWTHLLVREGVDGLIGVGEVSVSGAEPAITSRIGELSLEGSLMTVGGVDAKWRSMGTRFVDALISSGIEQALWDLAGKRHSIPTREFFGKAEAQPIPVYININPSLYSDRRPEAFAGAAERAVASGFTAVKCAPFDGLRGSALVDSHDLDLFGHAIQRLRHVRDALGSEMDLMVDCAGSFTGRPAQMVVDNLDPIEPYWIEDPVEDARIDEWVAFRGATTHRLAGGERFTDAGALADFMVRTGVDVVLPDVKYVGVSGMRRVAQSALDLGIEVSPHNPTGPVATAVSTHVVSDFESMTILELAHGECSWRSDVAGYNETIEKGHLAPPRGYGYGVTLDPSLAVTHPPFDIQPADWWADTD